jgi:alpha-L-fucosidase 2
MHRYTTIALHAVLLCSSAAAVAQQASIDTAWRNGQMQFDTASLVGRSDIILGRSNKMPSEALPLGNGRLGVAVWSEEGFTAQLNRADTMPYRYSTGQLVIPGLAALTAAPDYAGRLNLYNGAFEEHGAGMTATAYIQPHTDTLIVDITGANPDKPQTAVLKLWELRKPHASAQGSLGILSESWLDNTHPGASGLTFGSLSAITADGLNVSATVTDPLSITITLTPYKDGHFRILIASPHYQSEAVGNALTLATKALADRDPASHAAWWHNFWHHADLIKLSSQDGSGEYMENLRNIYLFSSAAENGGQYPGSQAGVGDLFSAARDQHQWDPSAFWHWNLRMQVAANLGAGLPELNEPYFSLYRDNLSTIEQWTKDRMNGAPGICIPETMRFNGKGIEYETWGGDTNKVSGWNCDATSGPYYNARTLSTGAEVSLWIWQQYLATEDKQFLIDNFPVMTASARFLLAYEKPGPDGLLHTSPSNAHETQWDIADPTTDLAARQALYAATIEAATLLHQEPALIMQLRAAIPRIPPFPHASAKALNVLLKPNVNANSEDVIATSYQPDAEIHNVENIGLEPVWPYDLIGDTSPLFDLARRTYFARPNKAGIDWSFDPVQAARLGLGAEVRSTLLNITHANQHYINGFAKWGGDGKEFYVEQTAIVALALQEALAQDYDGVIRIAPAIPPGWDFDGSVAVRKGTKVDVQVRQGVPISVGLEVKTVQSLQVKNPWPGEPLRVTNAKTGAVVQSHTQAQVIHFLAKPGVTYRVERESDSPPHAFAPVVGQPATSARKLGSVQIGLEPISSSPPATTER